MRKIKTTSLFILALFIVNIVKAKESIESHIKNSNLVKGLTESVVNKAISEGVWNNNKKALAISIPTGERCVCLVALNINDKIKIVNVSALESSNFGKLGYSKEYYSQYKTYPVQWYQRANGEYQIKYVTKAWKGKKTFTVSESLVIKSNGKPIYR